MEGGARFVRSYRIDVELELRVEQRTFQYCCALAQVVLMGEAVICFM
jgi:hypothetical protein